MTSITITASKCVNASEVALLVACFMPFLPRLGHDSVLRANAQRPSDFVLGTPHDVYSPYVVPHAANNCAKVEQ